MPEICLGLMIFDSENFKTLLFVLIFRKHSEPKTEYDLERDALKNAFAENTFDKLQNKKFGGSKYQDDTADEVELEMENMVRSKTQKLWNITLQVKILHKVLKKHFPYKPNSDSKEFNTIKV